MNAMQKKKRSKEQKEAYEFMLNLERDLSDYIFILQGFKSKWFCKESFFDFLLPHLVEIQGEVRNNIWLETCNTDFLRRDFRKFMTETILKSDFPI